MNQEYNYNLAFLQSKQPTSAREVAQMAKQRNPIIEANKNMEKCLVESKQQTQVLNNTKDIIKENAKTIEELTQQVTTIQKSSNKQHKTTLIVSIVTGLFAAGSFILSLIQVFK